MSPSPCLRKEKLQLAKASFREKEGRAPKELGHGMFCVGLNLCFTGNPTCGHESRGELGKEKQTKMCVCVGPINMFEDLGDANTQLI